MDKSVYSSSGLITSLLIFDNESETLDDNIETVCNRVWTRYKYFFYDMNAYHDIHFVIVFRLINYNGVCEHRINEDETVTYIYFDAESDINFNGWTQDALEVCENGKVISCRSDNLTPILDKLKELNLISSYEISDNITAGGSLLIDSMNQKPYLISTKESDLITDTNKYLGQEITKHFVWEKEMGSYQRLFFHTDLFVTILGETPNSSSPLLLVGRAINDTLEHWNEVNELNQILNHVTDKINGKNPVSDSEFRFRTIRLPWLPIFNSGNSNDSDPSYILSYNNCLVENYSTENGERKINLYFPDYIDYYQSNIQINSNKKPHHWSNKKLNHLMSFENTENSLGKIRAKEDLSKLIRLIQFRIHEQMALEGIYNVTFVRYPFQKYADSLGSLHCRVKVLKRI